MTRPPLRTKRVTNIGAGSVGRGYHPTAPNNAPTPAVSAIASAPQNVTRTAPIVRLAPPANAASPPSAARKSSDDPATAGMRYPPAVRSTASSGRAAPTAKQPAEVSAAWMGRALNDSENPSSSRAWAARMMPARQ
jgi:hypothetical protein